MASIVPRQAERPPARELARNAVNGGQIPPVLQAFFVWTAFTPRHACTAAAVCGDGGREPEWHKVFQSGRSLPRSRLRYRPARETGGCERFPTPCLRRNQEFPMPRNDQLPPTFNRLAWSNLAAQSAEQIALAAAPIVAVLLLGVGEGQTGLLQTALTLPFILFAIPAGMLADRISRRWLMAGAEALRAAALLAILLLIWTRLADAAAARSLRLHRGMRNGSLQRGRARIGTLAGIAATTACRQCADRTGPHHRLRQRTGAGRRAGRMAGRRHRPLALPQRCPSWPSCCCQASTNPLARRRRSDIRCRRSGKARCSCFAMRCCGRCSSPSSSSIPAHS